jgi:beta-glucanase (GH16 family)
MLAGGVLPCSVRTSFRTVQVFTSGKKWALGAKKGIETALCQRINGTDWKKALATRWNRKKITKKAHASRGHETIWEIPMKYAIFAKFAKNAPPIPRLAMQARLPVLLLAAFLICVRAIAAQPQWELVWEDGFNTGSLDVHKWAKVDRGQSDWDRHMSHDPACYEIREGKLFLRGILNTNLAEPVKVITGGITTKGKFSFTYGKVEIRAKLGHSKGAWPAFWMLPSQPPTKYKHNGEIDIMEHLNFDNIIYQTVHTHYTLDLGIKTNPISHVTAPFNPDDFNVFGLEWFPDKLVFTVNDQPTFTYPRIQTDQEGQWPFDQPFYLLIDMQLGGSWVGEIDYAQLPVQMEIDSVKVFRDKSVPEPRR